mmetsp:Transcript_108572/g.324663  ORF Transcript_108572/g.324663 Transcript_108572/m.324663 type:complete len:403 (+) Transcript_108572:517-1725(+)
MSVVTSFKIVGPTKFPFGWSSTLALRPSKTTLAPCCSPEVIRPSILALAAGEITGPRSADGSVPGPSFSCLALAARSLIHSCVSPTKMAVDSAMQRCPAAPKAAPVSLFRTDSLSASGRMTPWFFAPMLACTRLPLAVPRAWMCWPAALPPTKEIARISGASQIKFTASCVPWMTFTTPSGTPASRASSTSLMAVSGTRSDGFMTKVLPQVMATGNIQSGIMAGKLKGQMPAQTPSGWRTEYVSTSDATCSDISPAWMAAMLQLFSTTSRPRKTSPLASAIVLPCSFVMILASSSVWSRIRSAYLNMMRWRAVTGTSRQDLKASLAISTACRISSGVDWGTLATTSLVAGLCTSYHVAELDGTALPLRKFGTCDAMPRLDSQMISAKVRPFLAPLSALDSML